MLSVLATRVLALDALHHRDGGVRVGADLAEVHQQALAGVDLFVAGDGAGPQHVVLAVTRFAVARLRRQDQLARAVKAES